MPRITLKLVLATSTFWISASLLAQQTTRYVANEAQISKAVAYGESFPSRNRYLEGALKRNKFQIASAWSKDGISKYFIFFSDFDIIASAASEAKHEMRHLTKEDIQKLPLSGLVYVNVQLHARGTMPVRKLEKRFTRSNAHLVFEIDGRVIQPISKQLLSQNDASVEFPVALFTWWETKNISLVTGGTLGYDAQRVELEFAFSLAPDQMNKEATVILIDGDERQYKTVVNLTELQFGKGE